MGGGGEGGGKKNKKKKRKGKIKIKNNEGFFNQPPENRLQSDKRPHAVSKCFAVDGPVGVPAERYMLQQEEPP